MAKCPNCSKDIDHLIYTASEFVQQEFRKGGKFGTYSELLIIDVDHKTQDYDCPSCGAVLFHKQEEALKFLEGVPHYFDPSLGDEMADILYERKREDALTEVPKGKQSLKVM